MAEYKKTGLMKFGYCGDFGTQQRILQEINQLTGQHFSNISQLTDMIAPEPIEDTKKKCLLIQTTLVTNEGKPLCFWFSKYKDNWSNLEVGTEEDFKFKKRIYGYYSFGNILFTSPKRASDFLQKIQETAMPETWKYTRESLADNNFPILKSYLTFTFQKLKMEDANVSKELKKIQEGKDAKGTEIIGWNSNLLDTHFEDILIKGEKLQYREELYILDPEIASERNLKLLGVERSRLLPPSYFEQLDEIVFHADWKIEWDNREKLDHVLKRKDERSNKAISISQLRTAVDFSMKMAQRNYRFIVPMYYPAKDRIQLLMPLYFNGVYNDNKPDCALVLSPDPQTQFYIPETILDLLQAYTDARLIVRPESVWLDPNKI